MLRKMAEMSMSVTRTFYEKFKTQSEVQKKLLDWILNTMIGIVIVTHRQLGESLIDAAQFIVGSKPEAMESISIDLNENADALRDKIVKGIKNVSSDEGVLILTDMFGGTPSNLSYSFLEEGRIEVLSGVNLPVLIKAINSRPKMELTKLTESLEVYGKKSISMASSILKGKSRK